MIYTDEFLQSLSLDEVKDILKNKLVVISIGETYPIPYDKQDFIKQIFDFQSNFGNTESKFTPELNIGDVFLTGGSDDETDITYNLLCEIVSIDRYKLPLSEITDAVNESILLFDEPIISMEQISADKYTITYKINSMQIENGDWEEDNTSIITKTFLANERHIVKQPLPDQPN